MSTPNTPPQVTTEFDALVLAYKAQGLDPAKYIDNYSQKAAANLSVKNRGLLSNRLALPHTVTNQPNAQQEAHRGTEYWLSRFITQDPAMLSMKDVVRKLSKIEDAVLITGETGTGKEIIAHALHGIRPGNFVALNCGGFPEHLIESELFGHVKGAFTGAWTDKMGLFKAAENGTLFLDEIGELPLLMQTKLLRVIQNKRVRRVGDTGEIEVNCRVIAATHQDILWNGRFREDLYWRISTFFINLTPLRGRKTDAWEIAKSLGADKSKMLGDYYSHEDDSNWMKGNVRELQQIIRRRQVLGT